MPEETLTCGVRTVTATDGTSLPVPAGSIGGVVDEFGLEVTIPESAPVQAFPFGNGYQVVVNAAPVTNSEAAELAGDLLGESLQTLAERVFLEGAPKAIEFGLGFLGILADVLTTTRTTREIFIRGDIDSVPVTYLILA